MKTALEKHDSHDGVSQILSRIDTQDSSFVVPLAEYLITHGCAVMVNTKVAQSVDYHLVVGDWQFVKQILEGEQSLTVKRMGIVWGERGDVSKILKNFVNAKVVFVTAAPLSSRLITDIFQFFFTDSTRTRDFRPAAQNLNDATLVGQKVKETDDRQRIARLIEDLFSSKEKARKHTFIKGLFFVLFLCLLPFVWYWGIMGAAFFVQAQTIWAISSRSTDRARVWHRIARPLTALATKTHTLYANPLYWLGVYKQVKPYEQARDVLTQSLAIEESLLASIDEAHALGKDIVAPADLSLNTPAPVATLSRLKNELSFLVGQLGLVQANFDALAAEPQVPFSWVKPLWESASGKISRARTDANTLSHSLEVYGALGGFVGKQTYLFLFQNSMELRPTGGFIGSIGLATFAEGRLVDFSIEDVYTVDGQLKGHVSSPQPILSLLGSEHWYLRDSNWDPDFRESGRRAAWFYEKETGTRVDGVVGVSVPFIVELLAAIGPMALADFNDTITADNFFAKSLYYTQQNFFPGSTQKKDFLGTLARAMLQTVSSVDNAAGVARAMLVALQNRTLMMYASDSVAQNMIEQYGWSGRVPEHPPCGGFSLETGECIPGFLSIVEANLGVNKANYFLKREITDHIILSPGGGVRETVFVEYTNGTSSGEAQGGGPYVSYIRFLVSPGSQVERIQVDGVDIPSRNVGAGLVIPPYRDPIEQSEAYTAVPIALIVSPGVTRRVSLSLIREGQFGDGGTPLIFQHTVQKQPGTAGDALRVSVTYPLYWSLDKQMLGVPHSVATVIAGGKKAVAQTGDFLANNGRVEYNTTLLTDRTATFLFLR